MKKTALPTLYFFIFKKKGSINDFYAYPACELSQIIATFCQKRVFTSYEIAFLEKSGVKIEYEHKNSREAGGPPSMD